jgi:DNA-binding MurR/RpiR family transcriptional regulator
MSVDAAATSLGKVAERLEQGLDRLSPAERRVAAYILQSKGDIAFETAESLARKLGLSAMTIGRLARNFGFENFKALKAALRIDGIAPPWLVGERFGNFIAHTRDGDALKHSLDLEIQATVEVYELVLTPTWTQAVTTLARVGAIHVAGFQTERGLALTLTNLLQYVRPNVLSVDGEAGNYAQVLANNDYDACLVIIDTNRHSRMAKELATAAHAQSIPVIIITDRFCDWGSDVSAMILSVSTETGFFWSSTVAVASLINLLVNGVVSHLGPDVEERLQKMSKLYEQFTGFA